MRAAHGVFVCAPFHSTANPPVGIAYLRASLARAGIESTVEDLNIEARRALHELLADDLRARASVDELFMQARRSYLGEALAWSWLDPDGAEAVVARAIRHPSAALRAFWRAVGVERLTGDPELTRLGELLRGWLAERTLMLAGRDVGWVGLSLTVGNLAASYYVAALLRDARPDLLLVAGGPHVSPRNAAGVLRGCPALDAVALSPAYDALARLLSGEEDRPRGILTRADGSQAAIAPPRHPPLDELPFADWSGIELARYAPSFDVSYARGRDCADVRTMPLQTSRGCAYARCEFCHNVVDYPRLLMQTPARVAAEVEEQHSRHGVVNFFFTDDEFNSSRRRVREIGARLLAGGLDVRFMAWMRIDKIDEAMLDDLYAGGCRQGFFGVEAVDDELLDAMTKGYDADRALAGLRLLRRFAQAQPDFRFDFNLIVDHPRERLQSVTATLRTVCEEPDLFVGHLAALCRYHVYEGTPAFARYGREAVGCLDPIVPPGVPVDSFRYLLPIDDARDLEARMEAWSAVEQLAALGRRGGAAVGPSGVGIYD
ncbi:MAG: radical SAM protein [Actinobacteria bacterium]|nr:radical SAM protein [Actinomycetota bacterium]